jgi:hypothetical protein
VWVGGIDNQYLTRVPHVLAIPHDGERWEHMTPRAFSRCRLKQARTMQFPPHVKDLQREPDRHSVTWRMLSPAGLRCIPLRFCVRDCHEGISTASS